MHLIFVDLSYTFQNTNKYQIKFVIRFYQENMQIHQVAIIT